MPLTRTYRSILRSLNIASVAMPSLATASRIPCPQHATVARLPVATARSIPRPVNSLSVARRYTPTVQRASPSTSIASLASSLAAMSISKPVKKAIASPSATKPTSSLLSSKHVSDRIQARRQRVIANLNAPKKRRTAPVSIRQSSSLPSRVVPPATIIPTAPASILQSSSMPSRAVPPATIAPVSILKSPARQSRVIPPPSRHAPPSTHVSSRIPRNALKSLNPRGEKSYCEGGDPRGWATTPAEADIDPTRRRIVRFAEIPVRSTRTISRWWNDIWPPFETSTDPATEAEDDAAIHAMDNPPPPPLPPPPPTDFHTQWQAMMDQGFEDDDEYF